jgi:predicted dinucleotide-binding enzyme
VEVRIGVIGAGKVGGTLGMLWASRGHEIMFGARDPQNARLQTILGAIESRARAGSVDEAAAFGGVLLLAVPATAARDVIEQAGNLSGKILIDATNRMDSVVTSNDATSMAEDVARWAKGAKVVKAFNTTGYANLRRPRFGEEKADMFICGDDASAKSVTTDLAQEIGFDVVDVGPLGNAALLEALAKLWVQLAYSQGMGPDITFKILKREKP